MRISLLTATLVLAISATASANSSTLPAMVEVHKGRVFINLDRHLKNTDSYLAAAGRWTPIDPTFSWEARLGRHRLGRFRRGQQVTLFSAQGIRARCAVKRFVFLARGSSGDNYQLDANGHRQRPSKPLCGSPVLFAELGCAAGKVKALGNHALAQLHNGSQPVINGRFYR